MAYSKETIRRSSINTRDPFRQGHHRLYDRFGAGCVGRWWRFQGKLKLRMGQIGGDSRVIPAPLELAWGDVSVDEIRAANELDYICLESRTDTQKYWGSKSVTLIDLWPCDKECGIISLQSKGPWEGTLDDTSTFSLDIAWSNAMRVRWQQREPK
jgi:hypothetical protein